MPDVVQRLHDWFVGAYERVVGQRLWMGCWSVLMNGLLVGAYEWVVVWRLWMGCWLVLMNIVSGSIVPSIQDK